ncbi:MAG: DEAD/DEAH box helicase [Deltaproteobacteria bacterium]|nr:DEAD/DEAH box helicase [Deltaproteobacteria bacterium]
MKFESLNLNPDIMKGISDAGFERCTPIQEQSLTECLAGRDVIAQSQTGSGKTAVFLITIFSRVLTAGRNASGKPVALVMVPTRELASQVVDDAVKLGAHVPVRAIAIYGGVEYNAQLNALKTGVELVVATPGRMIDLYKSKALSLNDIEIFVIDEADRMFDMGFAPDMMYIAERLPKKKPRQTMLFSATIDGNVRRLASRYMLPDPVIIEIEPEQLTVSTIDQKVIYVSNEEKISVLLTLLKRPDVERGIIFTNMKITAERVGFKLIANGVPVKVLTGDVTQERRQKIMDGMKSGKVRLLVATDVAARGLHIDGVTHVFNYDLPDEAANYVHRIGRTARAGKSGKAYSLVCEDHALNLPEIEKYLERKLESEWIEDAELVKDVAPAYRERHRGDKKFGKRDKKPEAARSHAQPGGRGAQGRPQYEKKPEHPARHKPRLPQHVRKEDGHGGERPRGHVKPRPYDERKPWPAEKAGQTPAAIKYAAPLAQQKPATASKEEKGGILKRVFKFFKKS